MPLLVVSKPLPYTAPCPSCGEPTTWLAARVKMQRRAADPTPWVDEWGRDVIEEPDPTWTNRCIPCPCSPCPCDLHQEAA